MRGLLFALAAVLKLHAIVSRAQPLNEIGRLRTFAFAIRSECFYE